MVPVCGAYACKALPGSRRLQVTRDAVGVLLTATLPRLRRMMTEKDKPRVKPIDLMWYDITGDSDGIEYQITDTSNATHVKVRVNEEGEGA